MSLEGLRGYWLWLVTPIKAAEELINRCFKLHFGTVAAPQLPLDSVQMNTLSR
jgi:hypothetical protein